jgi:curli biogenesis system outer membrane secretion channel CsgG
MRFVFLSLLVLLAGCSSNPWAYSSAPGSGSIGNEATQKPVVYIEPFKVGSGVNSKWSGIAPEMQKAFTRALLKTGKFEVAQSKDSAKQSFASFAIESELTDFMHTSDAPESVRRLSWFTEANDAIVALDMTATNLRTGRVVFSDQLVAIVSAGDKKNDQYGSLEFGSYLFWSTPLGEASKDVLNEAVANLASLQGSTPGVVEITSYETGSREVGLSGGDILDDGGVYYVGAMDTRTGQFTSVDDDLGRPLRLRVEHHFFGGNTGWLLSEPAEYENITGSTLSKSPLPTQVSSE